MNAHEIERSDRGIINAKVFAQYQRYANSLMYTDIIKECNQ
jgi:hypothetical protein